MVQSAQEKAIHASMNKNQSIISSPVSHSSVLPKTEKSHILNRLKNFGAERKNRIKEKKAIKDAMNTDKKEAEERRQKKIDQTRKELNALQHGKSVPSIRDVLASKTGGRSRHKIIQERNGAMQTVIQQPSKTIVKNQPTKVIDFSELDERQQEDLAREENEHKISGNELLANIGAFPRGEPN